MIRAVAVLSLLVLLVLVLYVPSAHPPERFLAQLRAEHEAATAYWGAEPATRMLDRAMRMQDSTAQVTPIPSARKWSSSLPIPTLPGAPRCPASAATWVPSSPT